MNLQTLFDNFEQLAEAPNGLEKLRELILQLAMQGKLLSQGNSDKPASLLLKRIDAEKARLIKEKKIKKADALPSVDSDECPFTLPENWEWVYLDRISNLIHYGFTASANQNLDNVRLLRITDIQDNKVDWGSVPGCEIDKNDIQNYRLNEGDIVIARTGGTIGKSYLVKNLSVCAVFASYLIRVVPSSELLPGYLKLFLESPLYWKQLYEKSMGTGQPNVNGTALRSLLLPLPPFSEQKRILAKVDQLMKLCDELKERQQKTREARIRLNQSALDHMLVAQTPEEFNTRWQCICDNFDLLYDTPKTIGKLRQSILQLAVQGKLIPQHQNDEPAFLLLGKIKAKKEQLIKESRIKKSVPVPPIQSDDIPFQVPNNWVWVRLSEISEIGTGSTPLTSNYAYYENGNIPFITSAATYQHSIDAADLYVTESAVKDYRLKLYPPGTLIIALYGQGKTRGQISQLNITAAINQACATINFFEGFEDIRNYISLIFKERYDELRSIAAGGAQPNLNVRKIKNSLIALPPLEEQKRIVAKADQLMKLCDQLEAKLMQSQSINERLMTSIVNHLYATQGNQAASATLSV